MRAFSRRWFIGLFGSLPAMMPVAADAAGGDDASPELWRALLALWPGDIKAAAPPWRRLSREEREQAVAAAPQFIAGCRRSDPTPQLRPYLLYYHFERIMADRGEA